MRLTIYILLLGILIFVIANNCSAQKIGYGTEFHDFVTDFSQGNDSQLKNIVFPLTVITDNDTSYIGKEKWEIIDPCFGCEFSPILFMGDTINFEAGYYESECDTENIITVYLKPEKKIQSFHFKKFNDDWYLTELCLTTINDNDSESFFEFIDKFSSDISFYKQRLVAEFVYISYDLEKVPLEIVEMPLIINDLAEDYLFKRIYINNLNLQSDVVSLYVKGEGTGYHLEYYFKRINEKWYLIKLVDLGV